MTLIEALLPFVVMAVAIVGVAVFVVRRDRDL
jgi:Tfp pilus assembly protein PilV